MRVKDIESLRRKFELSKALEDMLDQAGRLRYGVPTSEKERLARSGELPGSPEADADAEEADRYAAGFLFSKKHPDLSAALQPLISRLKVSKTPLFGGSSPELQSYADFGSSMGRRTRR